MQVAQSVMSLTLGHEIHCAGDMQSDLLLGAFRQSTMQKAVVPGSRDVQVQLLPGFWSEVSFNSLNSLHWHLITGQHCTTRQSGC